MRARVMRHFRMSSIVELWVIMGLSRSQLDIFWEEGVC